MSADTAESLRDNFQVIFFCLCTVSFVWSIGDAHPHAGVPIVTIVSSTSFHYDTVNKHASTSSSHPTTLNVNNEKLKYLTRRLHALRLHIKHSYDSIDYSIKIAILFQITLEASIV